MASPAFTAHSDEGAVGLPSPVVLEPELRRLAGFLDRADNIGVQTLNVLNWPADTLLQRLPPKAQMRLEALTVQGLEIGLRAARQSRRVVPDQKPWINTLAATATGVMGGAGGLATSLAELPITITLMMRSVQAVAAEHGQSLEHDPVRRDCLLVFAADGPLRGAPGGPDMGFLAARTALTGTSVQNGIALIAPRLKQVLGQKLALQAAPVLGMAGAMAANLSYVRYYQDMARVVFGLRQLSQNSGVPFDHLARDLKTRLDQPVLRVI